MRKLTAGSGHSFAPIITSNGRPLDSTKQKLLWLESSEARKAKTCT